MASQWKGGLINHLYLLQHGHDESDVQTLVMRVFLLPFFKLLLPHIRIHGTKTFMMKHSMCLISCQSVYPVVGVRQGATGPGRRPCATPV